MYPGRQRGVSQILLGKTKILLTIDQVVRVYSFDLGQDSDSD